MLPQGFGHSRRISCDVFADIGASEYLLNATTYGWWPAGRLLPLQRSGQRLRLQPLDDEVVSEGEARTRTTASLVSGGMMIQGDDLTKPGPRERVERLFSNTGILALARRCPEYEPVEAATGSKAPDTFVFRESRKSAYVAVFNFDKMPSRRVELSFARLGLAPHANWSIHNLWTGDRATRSLKFELPPAGCALVRVAD